MQTIKLYETNSCLKEYDTIITEIDQKDGNTRISLKESIFFPEGGGQYADEGFICVKDTDGNEISAKVIDGQIIADEPWYTIEGNIDLNVGDQITQKLDWNLRYSRMQQHSGEHILMGVIHNHFGYSNSGFHLSDTAPITLVLSGILTKDQVDEMEKEANEMIYRNMSFTDTYPTNDELKNIVYRSKIEIEGQVRLITIADEAYQLDCCACCAPHVGHTGEVGLIKIVSVGKHKGGTSLGILSGKRAFEYVKEQIDHINTVSNLLSTSNDKVLAAVENYRSEVTALKNKVGELTEGALITEADTKSGQNSCAIFTKDNLSIVSMKNVFNHMTEIFSGYSGIFMGDDENGYRYSAGSKELDARDLAKLMREQLNAKGGGKSDMIQGKVSATKAQIEAFFENL